MSKLRKGDLIEIVWDDAAAPVSQYWTTVKEVGQIHSIRSVGYFMKSNKRYLVISQSFGKGRAGEAHGHGAAFSIPTGTIHKITRL